jgi:hypothetical protein
MAYGRVKGGLADCSGTYVVTADSMKGDRIEDVGVEGHASLCCHAAYWG